MTRLYMPILVVAFCLSFAQCELSFGDNSPINNAVKQQPNSLLAEVSDAGDNDAHIVNDDSNYDKRVERYAFGLGRRAYTYTNGGIGMKRLPVYNFGLGKRARPYSFGLGKRSDYEDTPYDEEYDRSGFGYNLPATYLEEKRNRPYSFGLGKRMDMSDEIERRGFPNRYGFGLGRR